MELKEAARIAYAGVMRAVSIEAATNAQANNACFKEFQLVEIPDVMMRMHAATGAALMRRWFAGAAFSLPASWITGMTDYRAVPKQHIDTSVVKMSWVSSFARTQQALATLKAHRINTPAAARELRRVLTRAGLYSPGKAFVENKNFRDWRALHKRGGDFVVFSDVLTKRLPAPINIQI